jgi:Fur family ferric uptake transcriptional regulator
MDTAQLEGALRASGLRVTQGRLAVLNALDARPHVDADSVYRAVLPALPGTSIQNVHNVLGDLTAAGLLRRIEPAHSPALYERRVGDNHHHVVCTSCGAVADVECVVGHAPCLQPSGAAGFVVDTAEVTFWGLCPSCQERAAKAPSHAE